MNPWRRTDLTSAALGRVLVIREPRVSLIYWRADGTYVLTGPDGSAHTGLTLANVLSWCDPDDCRWRVAVPLDVDLCWLEGR